MNRFRFDNNRKNIEKCPCGLPNRTSSGAYRFAAVKDSENTGKCFSCGKFFYNTDEAPPVYEPDTKFNYVPSQLVREMLMDTNRTELPLVEYFKSYFSNDIIEEVFNKYWVGHNIASNSVAFPYIDSYNNIRRVQYMKFEFDGKKCSRNKFYHEWDKTENPYNRCSFGENLINLSPKEICLVEAQRSALFLACADSTKIYLATGSKGNLQDYLFKRMDHRKVTLIPDADGYGEWALRGEQLQKEYPNIDFAISSECAEAIDLIGPNGDIEDLLTFKK